MRKLPQLVPIIHHDKDILLKCFSDTLVYHKENGKRSMVAIRFGGYPEQVHRKSNAAGSCHTTVCMQKLCL